MSTKSGIVVCRASYRKVFSASFRRMSFSTATGCYVNDPSVQPTSRLSLTALSAAGNISA